jgi:valacyclovir hydrolase
MSGKGSTVLLIHGTAASLWGDVVERLAADHQVIEYDRRSFGSSVAKPPEDLRRHTRDAAALLEKLAPGPAIVVGWSIGGVVALDLASTRPELVTGVVVVEAPLFAKRRPRPTQVLSILRAKIAQRRGDPRAGAEHFLHWALQRRGGGENDLERLPASWREAMISNAAAILGEIDAGTGEVELSAAKLRQLDCPVQWLYGDSSAPTFRAAARRATRWIPNLTAVLVPGTGHALQHDRPQAIVDAVAAQVPSER